MDIDMQVGKIILAFLSCIFFSIPVSGQIPDVKMKTIFGDPGHGPTNSCRVMERSEATSQPRPKDIIITVRKKNRLADGCQFFMEPSPEGTEIMSDESLNPRAQNLRSSAVFAKIINVNISKCRAFSSFLLALFVCAIVIIAVRLRRTVPTTPPPATESADPVAIDARIVAQRSSSRSGSNPAAISSSIAAVCGADTATADRYEARNDALRSIARERNLPEDDVAALTTWLASTNDVLHTERIAALKNDVMNLLRRQGTPAPDFADTLVAMFEGGDHPPAVLDYCIQHLGAMQGGITDDALRRRIRALFVQAAGRINQPYAGTALYALAEDDSATPAQDAELRRLTLALCSPAANAIARVAAIQLAGERCYAEALPLLREALAAPRRDAVTDIVRIGSLGLLGTADDIPLLRRFAAMGPRYATAAETAISRIEKRADDGEQR